MRIIAGFMLLLCASTILLADDHTVDFDIHTNFSSIKTFAIQEGKVSSRKPELNNPLFAKSIAEVIRTRLHAKGLKETADRPDIVIRFSVDDLDYSTVERGQDIRIPDSPGQRGGVIRGTPPHPVRYSEGTLIIDLTTGSGGALVWRGVYREKESDSTKVAQKLPNDAKTLLDAYPPPKNRTAVSGSPSAPSTLSEPSGPYVLYATSHLDLDATRNALDSALKFLERATPNNKGGYLEKAEADVRLALDQLRAADNFIDSHPTTSEPLPPKVAMPDFKVPDSEVGRNPSMDDALTSLHKAFDELVRVPGGSLGGFRATAHEAIAAAAHDAIAGINIAGSRGRGGPGSQ